MIRQGEGHCGLDEPQREIKTTAKQGHHLPFTRRAPNRKTGKENQQIFERDTKHPRDYQRGTWEMRAEAPQTVQ